MQQKLLEEKLEKERKIKEEEEAGVSWGMTEEAEDEEPSSINPFAVNNHEELFLDFCGAACSIIDRYGFLRQSKWLKRPAISDDSDVDNFFDRSSDFEKKRQKKLGSAQANPLTYDELKAQEKEIPGKIQDSEKKLESMVAMEKRKNAMNDDDLDDFMDNLDHKVDKFSISTIKIEIAQMKIELQKIQKLANIAKPSLKLLQVKGKLPLFGK